MQSTPDWNFVKETWIWE